MLSKPRRFRFPGTVDAKAKGDLAEAVFVVKARTLGLEVSKPLSESQAFDFHVQSRVGTFRVQVKSAWRVPRYHYMICFTPGAMNKPGGYDVLVVYIAPLDAWYVIPASAIEKRWLLLYPGIPNKTGRHEKYLEGWRTLTGDVRDDTRLVGLEIHAGRST